MVSAAPLTVRSIQFCGFLDCRFAICSAGSTFETAGFSFVWLDQRFETPGFHLLGGISVLRLQAFHVLAWISVSRFQACHLLG